MITQPPPLAADGFAAYAVTTRSGPHVTMQATAEWADRIWTTTSRGSLKARSVQTHGVAAATTVADVDAGTVQVAAGPTIAVSPIDPRTAAADPEALLHLLPGVLGVAAHHAEQLVGYLEAAREIPASWLPHRRLVLVTRPDRSLSLRGWDVEGVTGPWAQLAAGGAPEPSPRAAGSLPVLPDDLADLVRTDAPAQVGVSTPDGPVPLPGRIDEAGGLRVSTAALAAVGAILPGAGCVTFDDSAPRRPDAKRGAMLRGRLVLADRDHRTARLVLDADKITSWNGFRAETTDVAAVAPA